MSSALPCLLVTGGAGFVGSRFVVSTVVAGGARVVNLDKLTYAGNLDNLAALEGHPGHVFVRGDIADGALVARLCAEHRPEAIVSFAAESHVDRSIDGPAPFVQTNLVGTFELLEAARAHVARLPAAEAARFRFLQVSTDEVFGSLGPTGAFTEEARYAPRSPYAASKAGADHLVRAYHETYGLATLTTNATNNYGPYQFPEKLVPLTILTALAGEPLPVYGDGQHVRDWLHVDDHCEALRLVLARGRPGAMYVIGGGNERTNLAVVEQVCDLLDQMAPRAGGSYRELVSFVADRPGHDRRYAVDASRIRRELGWAPAHGFDEGLRATVRWYLDHRAWCARILEGAYRLERLGLGRAAG
jgi:dTDP-glucose 4,6-dehydratase